jgi:hypothetical protein
MPLEVRDAARLWDMLDAARAVAGFTTGIGFADPLTAMLTRLILSGERSHEKKCSFVAEVSEAAFDNLVELRQERCAFAETL